MNSSSKTRVAVLFGGRSVEHEISLITGLQLIEAIDPQRFEAIPVYIAQSGKWYTGKELLAKPFYRGLPAALESLTEVTLLPKPGVGGLTVLGEKRSFMQGVFASKFASKIIPVDVFLPAFHGQLGEDGCIQGLFEMADVTYTGSDVASSAVAMNKALCKAVASANGVPVLPYAMVSKREVTRGLAAAREKILKSPGLENFPLFVKPCHLGSSVGISKAKNTAELDAGLAGVFKYDELALIEPCVTDIMELNVSILDGETRTASVLEIPVGTDGVLSYEDKYMRKGSGKKGKGAPAAESQGMATLTRVIDPQDLDPAIKTSVTNYALKLSEVLGASGVSRFDFIVDTKKNQIYFNELNPLPGSLAFYLWEKSKPAVIYTELLTRVIQRAQNRRNELMAFERNTGFKALFS